MYRLTVRDGQWDRTIATGIDEDTAYRLARAEAKRTGQPVRVYDLERDCLDATISPGDLT